ncbi:MAG: hypothetical protein WC659_05910, partial [Patescibacteria group bacterium]
MNALFIVSASKRLNFLQILALCTVVFFGVLLPFFDTLAITTYGAKNQAYPFGAYDAFDPEGESIYLNFNWGDGSPETRSPASGMAPSGSLFTESHTWSTTGVFTVYAVSCDSTQCSLQSIPEIMDIQLPTQPGTPALASGTNPSTTGTFSISWTPSDPHTLTMVPVSISQYDVYRGLNGNPPQLVGSVTSPSYSETNLPDGTYDYYTVARDDTVPTNFSNPSGTYQVIVSHPGGGTPPTAEFDWCTLKSDTVQYQDLSTDDGSVTGWEWDFGDGYPYSSLTHPIHNYSTGATSFKDTIYRFAKIWSAHAFSTILSWWQDIPALIVKHLNTLPSAKAQTGISVVQTVTGTVTTGNIALPSWTPQTNELVLVAVAVRNETLP